MLVQTTTIYMVYRHKYGCKLYKFCLALTCQSNVHLRIFGSARGSLSHILECVFTSAWLIWKPRSVRRVFPQIPCMDRKQILQTTLLSTLSLSLLWNLQHSSLEIFDLMHYKFEIKYLNLNLNFLPACCMAFEFKRIVNVTGPLITWTPVL